MHEEPIKNIFIVDDHQLVIDGISSLINGSTLFKISGFTTKPLEVVELLKRFPSDVLLTDISMPQMNGIELTRLVKKSFPAIKVIAISMHGENQIIKEMLDAGVSGYILKNTGKHELIEAITKVSEGGTFFDENITKEILNPSNNKNDEKRLTPREIEIIRLIEKEYSNRQISDKLFISERTVETHRKNIFRKTNTQSVIGLMKYAYSMKII